MPTVNQPRASATSAGDADRSVGSADGSDGPDGRRARRQRNLETVLDTARQLLAEDARMPTVERIAQRSGLSARSIYRYFDDPEALISAAIRRSLDLGRERARIPSFGHGTFDERVARFSSVRVQLFESTATGFRTARSHALTVPQIRDALAATYRFLREQVEGQFAAELAALSPTDCVVALGACDAISQFDSLDYLRRERGATVAECESIIARTIDRVLGPG